MSKRHRQSNTGSAAADSPTGNPPVADVATAESVADVATAESVADVIVTANGIEPSGPIEWPVDTDTLYAALADSATAVAYTGIDGVRHTIMVPRMIVGIALAFVAVPVTATVDGIDGTAERMRMVGAYRTFVRALGTEFNAEYVPNRIGITGREIGNTQCDVFVAACMLRIAPASGAVAAMWRALLPTTACDFIARWHYPGSTHTKMRHGTHPGRTVVPGGITFAAAVDNRRTAADVRIVR